MESQIRRAAILVCIGMIVALVSLLIRHPLAFIVFVAVGVALVALGVVYYLRALARWTTYAEPGDRGAV